MTDSATGEAMFERLGSITFRYRFVILVLWIAAAVGSVLFAPSLAKEGMTDQSKFLPATAPAVQARQALEAAFPGSTSTSSATLSFSRDGGLTQQDRAYIDGLAAWLTSADAPSVIRDAVEEVATPDNRPELESMLRSDDGELDIMAVNLEVATASGGAEAVVSALRAKLAEDGPNHPGLTAHVTGSAAISSDYLAAIVKDTDSTTAVTVVLVIVILLLIYRAPLAALVPLVTIGAAFLVARGVLGVLAAAGWQVSSLLDTFIVVLVFGVGTDYAIFLISRYREEITHDNWHDAARTTVRRIGAVITASAATVVVGLGSMAFADFGMLQTMGPALAIAIVVTLIAGLTLTPALLSIFGHYLFWPLHKGRAMGDPGGFFARLASAVSRRPGLVTLVLLVALALPASYIGSMRTNFDVLAELPSTSDARAGFDEIAAHLGRGKVVQATGIVDAGPGADILAPASLARLRDMSQDLVRTDGVATVTSLVSPEGDGVVPDGMRPSKQLAEMADAFADDDTGAGTSDSEALLDDEVTEGLDTAREYLGLLGAAFPDVSVTTAYRTATDRLGTARDDIDQARESADVGTQLRALSRSMTSPTTAAAGDDSDSGVIGDYLDELAAAYPQVRGLAAYRDATRAAASLEKQATIAAALDASSAFSELATWFDDNLPDATLFPDSLAGTAEAKERRAEVQATFDALPGDFTALAAEFADRPDDVFLPVGLSGETGQDLRDAVDAFVSGDRTATRFYVTTSDDPYALGAFDGIRRAQDAVTAHATTFGPSASGYLGGATADFADVQAVIGKDFERVGVITVVGILIVLMILLRAVVAPLYLVGTVLLSCATALGLSAWLFQEVQGSAGVSFYLPLLVFVLLVALGSDYNIFLMSRVREESEHRPIREGIRIASGRTGAVITSAGLILAGTFGSMATAELAVLFQVGVAVALGVLIDTFVVRSILVPAITTLFGDMAWWPFGRKGVRGAVTWPVVVTVPEAGGMAAAAVVTRSRRRLAVVVAMLALVPVMIAGLAVWSLSNPTANLDRITAAVVNEDEGATMTTPDGTEQRLALGADLAAGLSTGATADTFTWVEAADAAEAHDGLASGRYGAVLTIPSDFSRTIAAIRAGAAGGEATAAAQRAKLQLTTDDASSYLLGSMARSISDTIALSAAEQVTAAYVDDVLLSVTDAQGRIAGTAADAQGVATGSTDLASGASTVSTVAGELVAGLEEMASGTSDASSGFEQLASGIDQLAIGTRKVATGASKLSDGTQAAANGSTKLAAGAESLAGGLQTLYSGTPGLPGVDELPAQTEQLATGAKGVSDGVDGTVTGLDALANQILVPLNAQVAGTPQQPSLGSMAGTVAGLATGLAHDTKDLAGLAGGAAQMAQDVAGRTAVYTGRVSALASDCATLGGTPELCAQLADIVDDDPTLATDAATLAGQVGEVAGDAGKVAVDAGTADALAGPLALLAQGAEDGIGAATGLATKLYTGLTQPQAPGYPSLQEVAHGVSDGTDALAAGMPALADGVKGLASGAGDLSDGMSAFAGGMATLASGSNALASGAGLTADGAARIAGGTSQAADGASELAGMVDDVVDAGRLVQAEADGLAEDGRSIADDATDLSHALEGDAAAIPTWSAADRETLGGVVANPVTVEAARLNALGTTGSGLAPYFMAIALWVGALATYLVLPAVLVPRGRPRRWAGAILGFLVGAAVGVAQAVVMVAALDWGVGIEVARAPELFAFAILVAVTAAAVTQAMVALFGMRGWFLALAFVVLQLTAAGAWFPVETAPGFFGALHPLLPMTYALEGFRTLIAGSGASLAPAVAIHLAWTAGALAVTLAVAAWRTRHETPEVMPAAT